MYACLHIVADVIKEPMMLATVHPEVEANFGTSSLCAGAFSPAAGRTLDQGMRRWLPWLVLAIVLTRAPFFSGALTEQSAFSRAWDKAAYLYFSIRGVHMLFEVGTAVLCYLCLRASAIKTLLRKPGAWYYIVSVAVHNISAIVVFTFASTPSRIIEEVLFNHSEMSLLVILPLLDAMPARILSVRLRIGALGTDL